MNIDRITIRRLKTYGNYDNVSVELSCPVDPPEAWGQKFAELDDMVSLKLAQLIERDATRDREYHFSEESKRLKEERDELQENLREMRQWIDGNRDFVRMYETLAGKNFDCPF